MVRISQSTRNGETIKRKRNEAYNEASKTSPALKSLVDSLKNKNEPVLKLVLKITSIMLFDAKISMETEDFFTLSNVTIGTLNNLSYKEKLALVKYLSEMLMLLAD